MTPLALAALIVYVGVALLALWYVTRSVYREGSSDGLVQRGNPAASLSFGIVFGLCWPVIAFVLALVGLGIAINQVAKPLFDRMFS